MEIGRWVGVEQNISHTSKDLELKIYDLGLSSSEIPSHCHRTVVIEMSSSERASSRNHSRKSHSGPELEHQKLLLFQSNPVTALPVSTDC